MTNQPPRRMVSDQTIARLLVAAQITLLAIIVLLPADDHWGRPIWLRTVASVFLVTGIVVAAIAAFRVGPAVTAETASSTGATLDTDGLQWVVRHPIMVGLLIATVGATIHSGNVAMIGVALMLAVLFGLQARWEDARQLRRGRTELGGEPGGDAST